MPKSAIEAHFVFLTSAEELSNPELIIDINQIQLGGERARGKFANKDNRKGPHNRDRRDVVTKPETAPTSTPAIEKPATDSTSINPITASGLAERNLTRHTLEVTDEDYLLGVADLTGELMRLAINTLGQSLSVTTQDMDSSDETRLPSPEERVQHILSFLRNIKSGFDGLVLTHASPIAKKMGTFKQSLNKIEMACYNVKVRGAEYPPDMLRQMLMSGGGPGGPGAEEDNEE